MADITPGTTVTIKIVKEPASAAARKTLVRLLSKDPAVVAENKRLKKVRQANQTHSPRGGRWRVWEGRLPKQRPVTGVVGESGTILASVDVLTDLKGVEKFVEVSAT
ncbi:MAG: hypothetical protein MI741_19380 [Rhodospirillales bacterium]|nr:hypothetical protein [Rhodospirillales bacterium]